MKKTLNISVKNNNDFDSKFRGIARKISEAKDDIVEFEIPQNESILKEYEVESTSDIISSTVEDDMRVFEY